MVILRAFYTKRPFLFENIVWNYHKSTIFLQFAHKWLSPKMGQAICGKIFKFGSFVVQTYQKNAFKNL